MVSMRHYRRNDTHKYIQNNTKLRIKYTVNVLHVALSDLHFALQA